MTTTAPPPAGLHTAPERPGFATRVRRAPVLTASLALFVLLIATLVLTSRPDDYTPLSTENSTPDGTRAVAQILREQGVEVRQTSTLSGARITNPDSTTLVIADGEPLAEYQIDSIAEYPGDLVLVRPSQALLDRFDGSLTQELALDDEVASARCDDPDATAAERIRVLDGALGGASTNAHLCFPNGSGQYAYAVVDDDGRRVAVLAAWPTITNEHLAEEGHAALGLRMLGREPTVVWYVGDLFDPSTLTWSGSSADGAEPPSEVEANPDFMPPGAGTVMYLLLITVGVAAWWRGRRFGPIVREPLPVVVRASESTRGRARLYRKARASGRAAAAMRASAAARMGHRLGVPRSAGQEGLVAAVARASGRSVVEVERILYGPHPHRDADMMVLIDEIDALESEVHRP